MGSAFVGVNVVSEGQQLALVTFNVLHRNFNRDSLSDAFHVNWFREDHFFAFVQVFYIMPNSAFVQEVVFGRLFWSHIPEGNPQALVQEG